LAKFDYAPSFVALAFRNGSDYRNADFKGFICGDLATSHKNSVKFGPVTPEFKGVVDQQFGYFRLAVPLLNLAGISTEFCG